MPPPDADPKFAYLWNCRAVLDQAVRIVLATDSDAPGQARTVGVLATFLSQTMLHAGPCNATYPAPAACLPGPWQQRVGISGVGPLRPVLPHPPVLPAAGWGHTLWAVGHPRRLHLLHDRPWQRS